MTQLAQVWAARTAGAGAGGEAKDILGRDVLTAYAPVVPLGWLVFVELPVPSSAMMAEDMGQRAMTGICACCVITDPKPTIAQPAPVASSDRRREGFPYVARCV
jgi:hypothetical protein